MLEEDNLDLMLPTKKKKSKKVDFDEGEILEKDDGEKTLHLHIRELKEDTCLLTGLYDVFAALEDDEGKNNDGISFSSSTGPAWAGSERDYTYDEVGQL